MCTLEAQVPGAKWGIGEQQEDLEDIRASSLVGESEE